MARTPFSPRTVIVARVRRSTLVGVPLAALVLIALVVALVHAGLIAGLLLIPAIVFIPGLILAGAFVAMSALPKDRHHGTLAVTEEMITLDDEVVCRRRSLRQAFASRTSRRPLIRLRTRSPWPIDVELAGEPDASALLLSLSGDERQSTLSFDGVAIAPRAYWGFIASLIAILGLFLMAIPAMLRSPGLAHLLPALLILVNAPALFWVIPRVGKVVAGADGVLIRRALGEEFHPYRSIHAARRDGSALVLELTSGKTVHMLVGGPGVLGMARGALTEESKVPLDALLARIASAQRAAPSASPDVADALARGERGVTEWIARVDRLLGPADYRSGSVPRERVWDVLEDPTQPVATRAAAAVALRTTLAADERGRLRVAKGACASRELEEVLEAVDGGDDDSIEGALKALRA